MAARCRCIEAGAEQGHLPECPFWRPHEPADLASPESISEEFERRWRERNPGRRLPAAPERLRMAASPIETEDGIRGGQGRSAASVARQADWTPWIILALLLVTAAAGFLAGLRHAGAI